MNRAERIFRLHHLLKNGKPVSLERIKEDVGMSRATVNREIAYMRDFMNAPILYHRERNGYLYDPTAPEFELPGLWFNQSELYALLASEQLLESVQPGLLSPYIGPLRNRVRNLLEQSGHSADAVTSRILLQPVAQRATNTERFGAVAGAVLGGRMLHIEYHGRERGTATRRTVHPYRLMRYRDNWYLAAWCEQANELRTFSLDRIRHADVAEQPVRPTDDTALDRHLSAAFGIFTGEASAWAVLRFSSRAARWVADETWHADQRGRWADDTYELQIPYSDDRELLMEILKYGADVEVIAPESLRQTVAQKLRMAAARYE